MDWPEQPHAEGCGCRLHGRRRLSLGLLGLAGLGAAGTAGAQAREGVDVGKNSSFAKLVPAEQVEQAAAQQYVQMQRQAAASRRRWRRTATRSWCGCATSRNASFPTRCLEPTRHAVEVGGHPDRQPADQRLLHARRQDRLLLGHPAEAAARRRRGGDDHGPRDGPRAARACTRAHGQDLRHARRAGARLGVARPGRPGTHGCRHGRAAADADLQPQRRIRGRPGGHGAGRPRRLQPGRRRHAVAEDGRGQQGRAAGVPVHPPGRATRIKDIEANLPKVDALYERAAKPQRRFEPPPAGDGKRN
jgi:hypothetical protein